jgi:hypothetical protein
VPISVPFVSNGCVAPFKDNLRKKTMALPAALAQLDADLDALANLFRDFAARSPASTAPGALTLTDECLLEGLLSHTWQAWNSFCRSCVIHSCMGSPDATGAMIAAHPQALSEELVAGAALDAKKRGVLPTYWGATVTSLRQEPTWGDTDVLQKILPRLQPTNAAKLVAAFSSVHDRAKAVQLIRNGAAHNHAENMAEILLLQSAYVAFRISHPVQALYWVEPSSGDFLITHALDALKDAALVAIS